MDFAKVIMSDIEKHEMKRVVDCELEFFVEGEGTVKFSYCHTLGLIRPDVCRAIPVAHAYEMHLYKNAEQKEKKK